MQKFVVVCGGRTGSNLLCGILDQHPYVACHYEVFNPRAIYLNQNRLFEDEAALAARNVDPASFIESLYNDAGTYRAVGFKLLTTHDAVALDHCLAAPDIKKIVLSRGNLLAQYSSQLIADRTQQWLAVDRPESGVVKVVFEVADFMEYVDHLTAQYEDIEQRLSKIPANDILRIEYSGLASRKLARTLFNFVGVPDFEIRFPQLQKQNTSSILDRFSNPAEVIKVLHEIGESEWVYENVAEWRTNRFKRFMVVAKRRLGRALRR